MDANAYCWVLIGKIANAIHSTKDDVYKEFIRNYSSKFIQMFIKNEESETFKSWWQSQGLGNICVIYPYDDEQCEVRAYIGSSKFTTEEMSMFISFIVTECHDLGISTATPEEISTMIDRWK